MRRNGSRIPESDWIPAAGCTLRLSRNALERWVDWAPASLCHWQVLVHDARLSRPIPGLPGFRKLYGMFLAVQGDRVTSVLPPGRVAALLHQSRVNTLPVPKASSGHMDRRAAEQPH